MTANETPADRLREAAGAVRAGWARTMVIDERGNRCALGAIFRANGDGGLVSGYALVDRVGAAAMVALAESLPRCEAQLAEFGWAHRHVVVDWNDHQVVDGTEVAEAMEKAAARLEERV